LLAAPNANAPANGISTAASSSNHRRRTDVGPAASAGGVTSLPVAAAPLSMSTTPRFNQSLLQSSASAPPSRSSARGRPAPPPAIGS
jgi:hypothetical protein